MAKSNESKVYVPKDGEISREKVEVSDSPELNETQSKALVASLNKLAAKVQNDGKLNMPLLFSENGNDYRITVKEDSLYVVNEDRLAKARENNDKGAVVGFSIVWTGEYMRLLVHRHGVEDDLDTLARVGKRRGEKFMSKFGGVLKKEAERFIKAVNSALENKK